MIEGDAATFNAGNVAPPPARLGRTLSKGQVRFHIGDNRDAESCPISTPVTLPRTELYETIVRSRNGTVIRYTFDVCFSAAKGTDGLPPHEAEIEKTRESSGRAGNKSEAIVGNGTTASN